MNSWWEGRNDDNGRTVVRERSHSGGGGGKLAAREGRKRILYSIVREGESLSERGRGTRKWSKVEKGVKKGTVGAPLILGPSWRYIRSE